MRRDAAAAVSAVPAHRHRQSRCCSPRPGRAPGARWTGHPGRPPRIPYSRGPRPLQL